MLFVEIDMEPLTSSSTGLSRSDRNEPRADPLPPHTRTDDCIDDKGVDVTVPGHIDKPDELSGMSSDHPAEAVFFDLARPVDLENSVSERFCVQGIQLLVIKFTSPLELRYHHTGNHSHPFFRCLT